MSQIHTRYKILCSFNHVSHLMSKAAKNEVKSQAVRWSVRPLLCNFCNITMQVQRDNPHCQWSGPAHGIIGADMDALYFAGLCFQTRIQKCQSHHSACIMHHHMLPKYDEHKLQRLIGNTLACRSYSHR